MASLLLSIAIVLITIFNFYRGSKEDEGVHICSQMFITKLNKRIIRLEYLSLPTSTAKPTNSTTNASNKTTSQSSTDEQDREVCRCYINNITTNVTITLFQSLPENIQNLHLFVNDSNVSIPLAKSDLRKEIPLGNEPVVLSVKQDDCKTAYNIYLEVKGDLQVNCTENVVTPFQECVVVPTATVIKANTELKFETPLLLIGAMLSVIGLLLFIAGIAVLRKYRKVHGRKKQTKDPKRSSKESNEGLFRKPSVSPAANTKYKQEEASICSSTSFHGAVTVDIHQDPLSTCPATASYKKHSISSQNTEENQKKKEKGKRRTRSDSGDEQEYSMVEEDNVHDNAQELPWSPVPKDGRVETPLLLVLSSAMSHKPLRKTENTREAQTKAMTMPGQELLNEGNKYSFLKKTGRLDFLNDAESTYDDATNSMLQKVKDSSTTIDVVNTAYPSKFPRRQKSIPNSEDNTLERGEGFNSSIRIDQDDQDHIYEIVEKEEDKTMDTNSSQSSQDNENRTHKTKPIADTINVNGLVVEDKCLRENKTADDILRVTNLEGEDQANNAYHGGDNTYESIDDRHDTDMAFVDVKNNLVDETSGTISIPVIIPVKMSIDRSKQLKDTAQSQQLNDNTQIKQLNYNAQSEQLNDNIQSKQLNDNVQSKQLNDNVQSEQLYNDTQTKLHYENVQSEKPHDNVQSKQLNGNAHSFDIKEDDIERNTLNSSETSKTIDDTSDGVVELQASSVVDDAEASRQNTAFNFPIDINGEEADTQNDIDIDNRMGEYTIVENIIYESVTGSQPPAVL